MKSRNRIQNSGNSFEKQVFEALKHYGYRVPKSEEEIDQYIRMFGSTKIELPESLKDAGAIFDKAKKKNILADQKDEIVGMAARKDKKNVLPEYIVEKIKKDIKEGKWLK